MLFLLPCRLKFDCVEMVGTIYEEVSMEDRRKYSIEDFGILNLEDLAVQPMDSSVLVNVTSLYIAKFLYNKRSSIIFSIQSIFIVYLCLSSSSSFLKAYYKNVDVS